MSSITAAVKEELARAPITKAAVWAAEISAMIRFSGGLHIISGQVVVEAELDSAAAANRIRQGIKAIFGYKSEVIVMQGSGIKRGNRYIIRVVKEGEALARRTGIIDPRGRPVRGIAVHIVQGNAEIATAAWRGAFLAHGSITEPGRSCGLEITCPGPESALALAGSARRIGVSAKSRDVRGVDRVVMRDGEAIATLLRAMGASETLVEWEERRKRREARGTANRITNFDDANLRRSVRAAVAAGARVERAFEILGDDIPSHLRDAGRIRVEHKQASLEELGQLSEPPLTKDAVAGRIRRILAMADKRAEQLGIPPTTRAVDEDILDG